MWSPGHSVREIEHSHDRVVVEESATRGAAWFFAAMALLVLVLWLRRPRSFGSSLSDQALSAFAVLYFAVLALWASARSTYTADRQSGRLLVERKILFQTVRTAYDAHTIDRVYVRDTGKGSGLYVRFKSGRRKRLSSSLEFVSLEAFAIALSNALDTHREP